MTPERLASLVLSLIPVFVMLGGALAWWLARADKKKALMLKSPEPITGISVEDDDHADEAIQAWRDRALIAEKRVDRLEVENDRLRQPKEPL